MFEHASQDLEREVAGVIVGNVTEGGETLEVNIVGVIPGEHTASASAHVTFTYETWDAIHAERERLFPEQKIVGWYHSHPGFGIFLSSYDKFICRNFFNLPWQFAIVVDPISRDRGIFVWQDGKLEQRPLAPGSTRFEETSLPVDTGDETPLVVELSEDEPDPNIETTRAQERSRSAFFTVISVLLLVVLALLALTAVQSVRLSATSQNLKALQLSSDSLGAAQDQIEARVASISENAESLASIESRLAQIEGAVSALGTTTSTASTTTSLGSTPTTLSSRAIEYVVQPGDSLSKISTRFYGDSRMVPVIAAVNGLRNRNLLFPGMRLVLLRVEGMK